MPMNMEDRHPDGRPKLHPAEALRLAREAANPKPAAPMLLGTELKPVDQAVVLASFVHRYTGDYKPEWAKLSPRDPRLVYVVRFKDDIDWLGHTKFPVNKAGRLIEGPCVESPTFPFGTTEPEETFLC